MKNYNKRKEQYLKKLKDPRWQKKRLEIFERDYWACQSCLDKESTLHLHHRHYLPEKDPWDYPNQFLVTLCESCHEGETEIMPEEIISLVEEAKLNLFAEDVWNLKMVAHYMGWQDILWREFIMEALEWACRTNNIFHLIELYFEAKPNRLIAAKEIPLEPILDRNGEIDDKRFKKLNDLLEDQSMIEYFKNREKDSSHGREISRDQPRINDLHET